MRHISYYSHRVLDRSSLLSHFESVKESPAGGKVVAQYTAKCPAHDTHHQSLAIGFTHDNRPLLHCFAGCSAQEILGAVGLSLDVLYPDGPRHEDRPKEHKVKAHSLGYVVDTYKRTGKVADKQVWMTWAKQLLMVTKRSLESGFPLSDEDVALARKVALTLKTGV